MQRSAANYGHKGPLKHIVVDGAKGSLFTVSTDAYLQILDCSSTTQLADRKALGCKLITKTSAERVCGAS